MDQVKISGIPLQEPRGFTYLEQARSSSRPLYSSPRSNILRLPPLTVHFGHLAMRVYASPSCADICFYNTCFNRLQQCTSVDQSDKPQSLPNTGTETTLCLDFLRVNQAEEDHLTTCNVFCRRLTQQ
ncbi:hypothetical protein AMECASPLE_006885 [Ameca splendens]|uniref:Uncharacterized protein n=1 Tax=Ameca splendens TaxID=208324 RepID=A0ABV0YLL9_9TELE